MLESSNNMASNFLSVDRLIRLEQKVDCLIEQDALQDARIEAAATQSLKRAAPWAAIGVAIATSADVWIPALIRALVGG